MSEQCVRVNEPPVGVTETGLGMMFAFERSVGSDEQVIVISIAVEASRATIVLRFFTRRLFKINYFISVFQVEIRRLKVNDFG
jgi:hypothetical protein